MATNKKGPGAGPIAKGLVIKDQGTVPYNGPKEVSTPDASKASVQKGSISKGGMGAMLRGGTFTY